RSGEGKPRRRRARAEDGAHLREGERPLQGEAHPGAGAPPRGVPGEGLQDHMIVDLAILAAVAVGAVFGVRAGASRQIAAWGALVVAALVARPGGTLLGPAFGRALHTSAALGGIAAAFATFIVVAVVARFLGAQLLEGMLAGSDPAERGADRALGGF